MDLSYSPEELSFRDEVRAFIRDHLPASIRARGGKSPHYDRAEVHAWHKILDARGWATPYWPPEFGGPGWSPVQRYIFMEELLLAPAPEPLSFNINMVGPVVFTFGSPEQKQRWTGEQWEAFKRQAKA